MTRLLAFVFLIVFPSCKTEKRKLGIRQMPANLQYYTNGNIKSIGTVSENGQPIGNWTYYDSTGVLTRKAEFVNICGETLINQDWYFDHKGDTLKNKGSHFSIYFSKDTIFLNEPIQAKVDLFEPLFKKKKSEIMVLLPNDYKKNFNQDFSNLKEIQLDTTYNLNLEEEMRKALFINSDFGKTAIFGRYFSSAGKQKFRGIIVEYFYQDSIISDSIKLNYFETKKYFEKEIYVLDSLMPAK